MSYLLAFVEFFRFIKHARERAERRLEREAFERAEERAHQRALLETIFSKIADSQRTQFEGLIAIAEAQRASSDVMKQWLDGFRIADPTPTKPSVAREEDEWVREQLQLAEHGLADIADLDLPPEFQLAFELSRQNQAQLEADGFDREGSDF